MSDEEKQEGTKKNKKINKMSVSEIDAALKKAEEHMGGHTSKYAQALIARKSELAS